MALFSAAAAETFDARAFRRELNKSGRYTRQPKNTQDAQDLMDDHGVGYSVSGLVARMKNDGYVHQEGDVQVLMASSYGFCWGVERAVRMAYEARRAYPDRKIWITNEIIHNPSVNQRLAEMNIFFIKETEAGKDFSAVQQGEVVILPAFGASVQEMKLLNDREVQIVDTTCPWVSKVWNAVDNQARKAHTSIIHGKWAHEETVATASFAGTYVIVKDLKECQYVCDYITKGGDKVEFLAKFENAMSPGFDPDVDLERVGIANQTTMLKGETQAIGKLVERTMMEKYGPAELNDRFMVVDTICDATQERQDAMYDLVEHQDDPDRRIDLMIVVGGFNSSNTSHLQEIAEVKGIPSFWVDSAARIDPKTNTVEHRTGHGEAKTTTGWIPQGPLRIGITSGASTPDRAVEDVLDKVFLTKNPKFSGVKPIDVMAGVAGMQYEEMGDEEI
jgi:4-hydroxy-3-methylbut-2-enyl diphosphate reductase